MRFYCAVLIAALLSVSCGSTSGVERGTLGILPAGHDVYLTLDPEGIDLQTVLGIAGTLSQSTEYQEMVAELGSDPQDRQDWRSRLSIDQGIDIGLVVDRGTHGSFLIALYLPGADPSSTEELFGDVMGISGSFEGAYEFLEWNGYCIVVMGESYAIVSSFDPNCQSIIDYDRNLVTLASDESVSDPDAILYFTGLDDERLGFQSSLLVELTCNLNILEIRLTAPLGSSDVKNYLSLLAPETEESSFVILDDASGLLLVNLDTAGLMELIERKGLDRELDTGIETAGFSSFADFLASFTGGACLTFDESQPYPVVVQLGLTDPDAISQFLQRLPSIIDPSKSQAITRLDMDEGICFRMDAASNPGGQPVEYGVIGDVLFLCLGCTMTEAISGMPLKTYIDKLDTGLDLGHSMVFACNYETLINITEGSYWDAFGRFGEEPSIDGVAGCFDVTESTVELGILIETSSTIPLSSIIEWVLEYF